MMEGLNETTSLINGNAPKSSQKSSERTIRAQALKESLFLDEKSRMLCKSRCDDCFLSLKEIFLACCSAETFHTIGRALFILIVWISVTGTCIGISYFYFNVLSNLIALPFADTFCDNFIWQTCHSKIESEFGNYFRTSLATFVGFIIHVPITMSLIVGLFLYFDPDACLFQNVWNFMCGDFTVIGRKRRGNVKVLFWLSYTSWCFTALYFSIFGGKWFSESVFSGCSDYKSYGIALGPVSSEYIPWKRKIQSIGLAQGAKIVKSLPGTPDGFDGCLTLGLFLSLSLFTLILPFVMYGCYRFVARYRKAYYRLKENTLDRLDRLETQSDIV